MKISIVNSDFSLGGVQRVAIEIAKGISELPKYEVSLFDFNGSGKSYYDMGSNISFINNKVNQEYPYKVFKKLKTKFFEYRFKLLGKTYHKSSLLKNQLKGLISYIKDRKIDCIIVCQGDLTALVPKIKAECPNLKIIAWQHNDYDIYFSKYYVSFLDEYMKGLKLADYVVCLTDVYKEKFKLHNSNTLRIYNPLTISGAVPTNLDSNNIIYAGRLAIEHKGLDYLVDICGRLTKKWNWLIAGDGAEKEKIERIIHEQGLDDTIKLLGNLSNESLKEFFYTGAIYVSPSRWEGMSLVIIEAMSFGLPVVAFDIPGTRETLDDGRCGILVKKFDTQAFSEAVEKLMNNKELREKYQKLALERVKDFSIESIIPQWVKIIEE